jgi:Zn-dependent protease
MPGAATLFSVGGIPIRVHVSWLAIFGLITWSLSVGYFPQVVPNLPLVAYWANGALAALLLFVSVLLHELSHAVVARHFGLPVAGITLHVFGGVSELSREPDRPGVEFRVALAGPLTSLALGAIMAGIGSVWPARSVGAAIFRYLALVNVVLGLFNLVPGFPLDGGRLLRAALWKVRGDLESATRAATRAGSTVAAILMALGIVRALTGEFLGGLWLVLIGVFLRQAAEGSYDQLLVRRALGRLSVRDVMTREVVHVDGTLTVARLVDEVFWRHHVTSFPVLDGARLVGIVSINQVKAVPQARWAHLRVRDIMQPVAERLIAAPADALEPVLQKLSQNGLGRVAVVEAGAIVGYLSLKDVLHVLTLSRAPADGLPASPSPEGP